MRFYKGILVATCLQLLNATVLLEWLATLLEHFYNLLQATHSDHLKQLQALGLIDHSPYYVNAKKKLCPGIWYTVESLLKDPLCI